MSFKTVPMETKKRKGIELCWSVIKGEGTGFISYVCILNVSVFQSYSSAALWQDWVRGYKVIYVAPFSIQIIQKEGKLQLKFNNHKKHLFLIIRDSVHFLV